MDNQTITLIIIVLMLSANLCFSMTTFFISQHLYKQSIKFEGVIKGIQDVASASPEEKRGLIAEAERFVDGQEKKKEEKLDVAGGYVKCSHCNMILNVDPTEVIHDETGDETDDAMEKILYKQICKICRRYFSYRDRDIT